MGSTPLIIRITGDASSFRQAAGEVTGVVAQMGQGIDRSNNRVESFASSLSRVGGIMSVGVTAPVLALAGGAIKASADMDTLRRALLSTAGSAGEANKQFERLKEIAKLPGIGLEEAVRGSIRLQNYGISTAQAEKALRGFSNAVAAAGGSADDTQESLRQLGQIFGRQKVTMDNLRIVLERVPQAAKIIREEFGAEALADPAKALEALGVNSEKFVNTLINRLAEAAPVTAGVKTALENLGQEVKIAAARIGDELAPAVLSAIPKLEGMAKGVADLVVGFTKLPPEIKNTVLTLGTIALAVGPISSLVGKVLELSTAWGKLGSGVSLAAGGLFGAVFIASIGQTASAIERLNERYADLRRERERMAKGGKEEVIEGFRPGSLNSQAGSQARSFDEASKAASKFKIDTKALADELGIFTIGQKKATESTKTHGAALEGVSKIIKVSTMAELAHVESLERKKTSFQKVKDLMYEYFNAGNYGAKFIKDFDIDTKAAAAAADDFRLSLAKARWELTAISNMPPIKMADVVPDGFRRGSVNETGDILAAVGGGPSSLQQSAAVAKAEAALARIKQLNQEGKATGRDVIAAQQALAKAQDDHGNAAKTAGREASRAMRQVSLVVNDLSREIAKSIIHWKGFGEAIKSVGQNIAESLLRSALETQLTRVSKLVLKLVGDFGGLGKVINGVFGSGAVGGGGTIFSAASGGASTAAGATGIGGSIGGAASSGIAGIVGAVGSVVSAVSGVVSNFQFAHMNTALGRIEESTRYVKIWTGEQSQSLLWCAQKTTEYMGYAVKTLDGIGSMTSQMLALAQQGKGVAVAGAGGVQVNMAGAYILTDSALDEFAGRLMRRLKENGL